MNRHQELESGTLRNGEIEESKNRIGSAVRRMGRVVRADIGFVLLAAVVIGSRVADHQLRVVAGQPGQEWLQDTVKVADFVTWVSGTSDSPLPSPPNYFIWQLQHEGKVPYPYPGWK